MEKGLADVRQDLEISKQRFWTQREDSTQEGGGSCEGTDGANIRGGQVSPVPWHGGQWGNRPLLCTSSLVSKIYTKQLPREKKTTQNSRSCFPFCQILKCLYSHCWALASFSFTSLETHDFALPSPAPHGWNPRCWVSCWAIDLGSHPRDLSWTA